MVKEEEVVMVLVVEEEEEEEGEDRASCKSLIDGFISIFVAGLITVCFEMINLEEQGGERYM